MFDDMKTKKLLEKIRSGGEADLSRSQIILSLVNLRAVFRQYKTDDLKKMPEDDKEKANAIIDWYKEIRKDKTKETYDQEKLDKVSEEMLAELKEMQGPTEEEIEKEIEENDEDVQESKDIDIDNFFGDDD